MVSRTNVYHNLYYFWKCWLLLRTSRDMWDIQPLCNTTEVWKQSLLNHGCVWSHWSTRSEGKLSWDMAIWSYRSRISLSNSNKIPVHFTPQVSLDEISDSTQEQFSKIWIGYVKNRIQTEIKNLWFNLKLNTEQYISSETKQTAWTGT